MHDDQKLDGEGWGRGDGKAVVELRSSSPALCAIALGRAIQYPETLIIETIGRGVLDSPLRGE